MDRASRLFRLLVVVSVVGSVVTLSYGCASTKEPLIDVEISANSELTLGEACQDIDNGVDNVEFVLRPYALLSRPLVGDWKGPGLISTVLREVTDAGVRVSADRLTSGWRYTLSLVDKEPQVRTVAARATDGEAVTGKDGTALVTSEGGTALVTSKDGTAVVTSKDGTAVVGSPTAPEPTVAGGPTEPSSGGAAPSGDGTAAAHPSNGAAAAPSPPAPPPPAPAPAAAPAAATRNIIRPGYLIYRPSGAETRATLDRRQTYQLNVADGDVDAGDAPGYASDMVEADSEIRMVGNGQGGFNFGVRPTNETVGDYGVLLDRTLYVRAEWAKQILGAEGPFWVGSDLLRSRGQWIWQQLREPPSDSVTP